MALDGPASSFQCNFEVLLVLSSSKRQNAALHICWVVVWNEDKLAYEPDDCIEMHSLLVQKSD